MRKVCVLFILLIIPFLVYSGDIPQPSGWVNDFAKVISPEYKEKLNSLIEELEQKTTSEIAVVTVDSIAPYDEKGYARLLFDNWKPGKKGKDNGVLVLVAIKERRWRIETGYGVEGILPDGLCGEIGRNYMVPYFKEGKYSEGLYYGVASIARFIAQDAHVNISNLEGIKVQESANLPKGTGDYPFFTSIFISSIVFQLIVRVVTTEAFFWGFFSVLFLFLLLSFGTNFTCTRLLILPFITPYILSLLVRFILWLNVPLDKRKSFLSKQIYGKKYYGGWLGGGGFGGGGGGGFGGGGGGGGGAGGGF